MSRCQAAGANSLPLPYFHRIRSSSIFILLAALASACSPQLAYSPPPPWTYASLRLLSPPGEQQPSHDLIALYARHRQSSLQIRLDLLDFTHEQDYDLYLALDTSPGGSISLPLEGAALETGFAWELWIQAPGKGSIQAFSPDGSQPAGLKLRVQRDPDLDMVVLSLNRLALPGAEGGLKLHVFLTPSGSLQVADNLGPVRTDSLPPGSAPLVLAFWNAMPAATPAQALRRWDCAHSGPFSERHGLQNLLSAVEAARLPVFLLDLKTPASLSALDYLGALPRIRELERDGLLVLPDVVPVSVPLEFRGGVPSAGSPYLPPDWVLQRLAQESRLSGLVFGLPASPFVFSPLLPERIPPGYRLAFTSALTPPMDEKIHPIRRQAAYALPLPGLYPEEPGPTPALAQQATAAGLSLQARRLLLQSAIHAAQNPETRALPVLLGGDLAASAWGIPLPARQTMLYLAAHPWIRPLTSADLFALHPDDEGIPSPLELAGLSPQETIPFNAQGQPQASGLTASAVQGEMLAQLLRLPDNQLAEAAWQAYRSLLGPATPQNYQLRAAYMGRLGHLLAAARWASDPFPAANCDEDLDWDGDLECVLASLDFFAVFEKEGGYLTYAAALDQNGAHLLVTPTSHYLVGVSDAMAWDPDLGPAGDPGQVPGAFADRLPGRVSTSRSPHQVESGEDFVIFTSPGGSLEKTFSLIPGGLRAGYRSAESLTVLLPLGLDPWERFQPGWGDRYQSRSIPGAWSWGLQDGLRLLVRSSGSISTRSFNESKSEIGRPEDPNHPYPPGHYLPFPLSLLEIEGQGDFYVEITIAGISPRANAP